MNENEIKKSYFAVIPANVRYDENLPPNAKLLFGEITALCNEKGFCWAGNSYFANLYNVSKTTVSRWCSALEKSGYISIEMNYKENSKEIDSRIIKLATSIGKKDNTPIDKNVNTYTQNCSLPIDEIVKDNNTVNTTLEYTHVEIPGEPVFDCAAFKELYNTTCSQLPKVRELSETRKTKIKARLAKKPDLEYWETVFKKANASDFCKKGNWCNFDWFLKNDNNHLKVFEGNYDNKNVNVNAKVVNFTPTGKYGGY